FAASLPSWKSAAALVGSPPSASAGEASASAAASTGKNSAERGIWGGSPILGERCRTVPQCCRSSQSPDFAGFEAPSWPGLAPAGAEVAGGFGGGGGFGASAFGVADAVSAGTAWAFAEGAALAEGAAEAEGAAVGAPGCTTGGAAGSTVSVASSAVAGGLG